MKAVITGASSGIGKDMARYLAFLGWDLILVARRKENLELLKEELANVNVEIYAVDLAVEKNVYSFYEKVKDEDINLFVNNAGFGLFGDFCHTDLNRELQMIDLNVKTYHIFTKLFLKYFCEKNSGYILNVCSSAGFLAGPNMATYYATKNYVTKLTMAVHEELRRNHSAVVISALCPGPVNTEFNKVAHGKFSVKGLDSYQVAKYAIDKTFKRKLIIVPGIMMKVGLFFSRFIPWSFLLKIVYSIQYRKEIKK